MNDTLTQIPNFENYSITRECRYLNGNHKGEKNANAKLTNEDVLEIRRLCAAGMLQREIGRMFGVDGSNVSSIKLRAIWDHI